MFPAARPTWAVVLVGIAAMPAFAQHGGGHAINSPVPVELTYRSTFDTYQRFTDEKVGSWRDANDTVGRIGGWRAYAKEGREATPQGSPTPPGAGAPSSPARAPSSSTNPHEGHGKQ